MNKRIDFRSFSLNFTQSANNYYIRNFSFQSPEIYFNTYGDYSIEDGLDIPVNLNIVQDNKTEKISLEIFGDLEAPCINVKPVKGRDKAEQPQPLCF